MNKGILQRRKALRGLNLIEIAVSTAIFAVLALAMAGMLEVGANSEKGVVDDSGRNRGIRRVERFLVRELRASGNSRITVTAAPGGSSILIFSYPVKSGGAVGWGARDESLGQDPDSRNKIGWKVRYRVVPKTKGRRVDRLLVREVLDSSNQVVRTKVLAHRLRSGTDTPPGFKVVKTGKVWKVLVSTLGAKDGSGKRTAVFHVLARN